MADFVILHLYPRTLKLNGEAGNVTALSVRATASNLSCEVILVEVQENLPENRPHLVFIGSGTLGATRAVADDLAAKSSKLLDWVSKGTKVLAVGSGFDLISIGLELLDGEFIPGLALTDTKHRVESEYKVGEVVLSSDIAGFINSDRSIFRGSESFNLGTVLNSDQPNLVGCVDGFKNGIVMASNVQGPLLPMNPDLADELLCWIFPDYKRSPSLANLDELAAKARNAISSRVGN
jgi:CobQ-like glutamine amidotransferase family enzyme